MRRVRLSLAAALVVGGLAMNAIGETTARADSVAGSQGTDTTLPATPSQQVVHGRGAFADLTVTVNQTADLNDQAVSIHWTGGRPTIAASSRFSGNFLQIMQCWGDDDGTVAENPGPPPEQCEQGAALGSPNPPPAGFYPNNFASTRLISRTDWPGYDEHVGVVEAGTDNVWMPFRSVRGKTVDVQTNSTFNPAVPGNEYWLNPYFDQITSNEIAGAATAADGTGAELFNLVTGIESSGLGCGQMTEPVADGSKKVPRCWIVIVPRGTGVEENAGTQFAADENGNDLYGVSTSPLTPAAWKNRIAIEISFNPVDSPCALGVQERRISGTALALPAVFSWQPKLCEAGTLPPYSFAPINDATARSQLLSKAAGAPGMVVVSEPISPDLVTEANPVVYSPLTLSGVVIGLNIERNPSLDADADERLLAGIRVADVHLTPRLVAKLLTQSYQAAVNIASGRPNYGWLTGNPNHLGLDPDFLQFNPEFTQLRIQDARTFASLELPGGNFDYARQLWKWILADPEAKAWMDGTPDAWGMRINPVYSTNAASNPNGVAFGDPAPNSFPKSEPYCFQAPAHGQITPPALCGTDWVPFRLGLADAARVTRTAADGAKIDANPNALTTATAWSRTPPQFLGTRAMLSITDTPSAAQFGVQMAHLSRAGDDGAGREFIAPDEASLQAGVAAMVPSVVPSVLVPSSGVAAPGAYPLTTLTYAAVAPLRLDETARSDYAAFIDYVAGPGQTPGQALGELPRGYAPLTESLRGQAATTSNDIRTLTAPTTTTTTTTTAVAATTSTSSPGTSAPSTGTQPQRTASSGTRPSNTTRSTSASKPSSTTTTTSAPELSGIVAPATTIAATTLPATTLAPSGTATTSTVPAATTQSTPAPGGRFAVPGLGAVAVGCALGALEVTKRPRRRPGDLFAESSSGGAPPPDPSTPEPPEANP